jgi:hypothetical protein
MQSNLRTQLKYYFLVRLGKAPGFESIHLPKLIKLVGTIDFITSLTRMVHKTLRFENREKWTCEKSLIYPDIVTIKKRGFQRTEYKITSPW